MKSVIKKSVVLVMVVAMVFSASVVVSSAATKSKTINLKSKTTSLSAGMKTGDKLKLTVKINKKTVKASKVTFKSSKKSVAAVSKKGVITAKKAGKATITIKSSKKTAKLKVTVKKKASPTPKPPAPPVPQGEEISLPFMSTTDGASRGIKTWWTVQDLDWALPNDVPNLNLTVAALTLATNIETTEEGDNQWTKVCSSLDKLGFTENQYHAYFEDDTEKPQKINFPAMVFATHKEQVNGKYVVAAVFRGSSSLADFITDIKSQLDKYFGKDDEAIIGGFDKVGKNGHNELEAYLKANGLTKENTTLFITGHSLGAATASLVGLRSAEDLADKNSVFCYSFATPNYYKDGLTGLDMKMFSFDNEEDIVPDVPLGLDYYKTLKRVNYDREWIQKTNPNQYALFDELYRYFRGKYYADDKSNFMPKEYSYKFFSDHEIQVNSIMVRNHMPYTYMALILSELEPDLARQYIN